MSIERRQLIRFPLNSPAEVQFRGMTCPGTLCDISLFGALFAFDKQPGDTTFLRPCRLHVRHFVRQDETAILFNGLAVHADAEILGIKFIGVGEKERLALIQMIDQDIFEPALLDRDIGGLLKSLAILGPEPIQSR